MRRLFLGAILILWCTLLKAQYEGMEYYQEQDPAVKAKLEQWQDLKFGFFVHWGPYSQKGYCESWTICTEDVDWIQRDTTISYDEYYRNYVNLKKTFNPVKFNPGYWADLAKEAGMKYSALLMLGIGGKGHSKESVEATAALLNKYPPYRVSPLSTAVLRGSELEELCDKGEYVQLTERELVEEEKMLLRALKINDCIFFGSHPYNLITISGVLPQDREEIIKHLDSEMAAWDRDQPGFLDTVWKRTDM